MRWVKDNIGNKWDLVSYRMTRLNISKNVTASYNIYLSKSISTLQIEFLISAIHFHVQDDYLSSKLWLKNFYFIFPNIQSNKIQNKSKATSRQTAVKQGSAEQSWRGVLC